MNTEGLRLLEKDVEFSQVFDTWRKDEQSNPAWLAYATEKYGWENWESWRKHMISFIKPEDQSWSIYEILDGNDFIPNMQIGPFSRWQEMMPEPNKYTFKEAMNLDKFFSFAKNREKIQEIMQDFPSKTQFIAVYNPSTNRYICLEGTHRSTAVAYADKLGFPIKFKTNPRIAIAKLDENEVSFIDDIFKRPKHRDDIIDKK